MVEDNRVFNDQKTAHTAVMITRGNKGPGDADDRDAVVRGNVACFPSGASGQVALNLNSAGASVSGNVTLTGEAATRGVCARQALSARWPALVEHGAAPSHPGAR